MTDQRAVALTRRRVRRALRRARVERGLTVKAAADAAGWSESKMVRLEDGRGVLKAPDVRELAEVYRLAPLEAQSLIDAVKRVQREPTLDRDLLGRLFSPKYMRFLELEQEAIKERQWHPYAVPGLLQTEPYADMVMERMTWRPEAERVSVRQSRMYRQQLIATGRGPALSFLIDESVFRRAVRPKRVMREQITRIIELASAGSVDVRVVPFSRGLHVGLHHSFILLEFEAADEDIVFFETEAGERLEEDLDVIHRYRSLVDDLSGDAMQGARLWRWLEEVARTL